MKLEYILKTMIMNTKILCVWIALLTCQIAGAQTKNVTWGDQGNGTYINPILNADYSDPDVIRVGDKYYMVNSDFHYMGMPVLESDDMINWKIISQVYRRLDFRTGIRTEIMEEAHGPPLSVIMTGSSGFTSVLPVKG